MLHQAQLFPVPVANDKNNSARIYAIITHGSSQNRDETIGFINIGFPRPDLKAWAEPPIPLIDVFDLIVEADARRSDVHEDIQTVDPKLKSGIKKAKKEEKGE